MLGIFPVFLTRRSISYTSGQCLVSAQFFQQAAAKALAIPNHGAAERCYGEWARSMAMLGDVEIAREIMEKGAELTGGQNVAKSHFWSPAYLMLANYSSKLSRDDVSNLHLEWGKWFRQVRCHQMCRICRQGRPLPFAANCPPLIGKNTRLANKSFALTLIQLHQQIGPYTKSAPEDLDRNRALRIGYCSGDFWRLGPCLGCVEGLLPGVKQVDCKFSPPRSLPSFNSLLARSLSRCLSYFLIYILSCKFTHITRQDTTGKTFTSRVISSRQKRMPRQR